MKSIWKETAQLFIVCAAQLSVPASIHAAAPNSNNLSAAISAGDFSGYNSNLSAWLNQQVPAPAANISEAKLKALLRDPVFADALVRRQFMNKVWGSAPGIAPLGAFANADPKNRDFLTWVMRDREIMDTVMLTRTPSAMFAREDDSWSISDGDLNTWKRIYYADPDSRQGLYLRLAIATVLRPPGTGNKGAGEQKTPSDPLVRYMHFKNAHKNKELLPSFDNLTAWELTHVVSSCASEEDLAWGREMVNTFMPQLRQGEQVVTMTSQMQYQGSQIPYNDFSCLLAGGGKCGPRSSFGVFINQAFGIPAIGVGQPAHAAVAYRLVNGGWQVAYGRGWNVSTLFDRYKMSGAEFLQVTAERSNGTFAQVEHLRWLASALTSKEQAGAVMAIAHKIHDAPPTGNPIAPKTTRDEKPVIKPEPPVKAAPGVIHVDAGALIDQGGVTGFGGQYPGVPVIDSYTGGKQLNFQALMPSAWAGYKIDVPATGTYELTARAATVTWGQNLYVRSFGAMLPVKKATASTVYKGMVKDLGPQQTIDNNPGTRWAVDESIDKCTLEIDLGQPTTISTVMIDERMFNRVSKFQVEYKVGNDWKTIFEGTNIGIDFAKDFPPVTAQNVRLNILDNRQGGPTIWEFSVGTVKDGRAWLNFPWTRGLWTTTKPVDIRLVKGTQTIWIFAPYQRGVALKWLELRPKAAPNLAGR